MRKKHGISIEQCLAMLLLISLAAPLLAACAPPPEGSTRLPSATGLETAWSYADLRLLDPPDADRPENDLLAVYLRRANNTRPSWLDIRLDFLEMSMRSWPDVFIALDYTAGGAQQLPNSIPVDIAWDALLHIPAAGAFTAVTSSGQPLSGLSARILRDPQTDSLSIRLDAAALYPAPGSGAPPELELQVFAFQPISGMLVDRTAALTSYSPPPARANLLLAFWNTYPAYTPAQALRRWDGAHSGPLGGRHGLSNLLRTASGAGIPLALLDLKYPPWLSALDYAGDLPRVADLTRRGLLLLPDYLPSAEDPSLQAYSQILTRGFSLPASLFAYAQSPEVLAADYYFRLFPTSLASPAASVRLDGGQRSLPLPIEAASQNDLQPDLSGLSLQARRRLVQLALSGDAAELLVLGGDLTRSTWGSPQVARAAFQYIRAHPWIRPLAAAELLSMPAGSSSGASSGDSSPLFAGLPQAGKTPLKIHGAQAQPLVAAAAQAYLASAPPAVPASPAYAGLQEIYARQSNVLLAAEAWAQQPSAQASCAEDIDLDSQAECVLASNSFYAVFDPALGALTHAFALSTHGVHQLIAPSSQFTFGTGDPAGWQPGLGLAADPQVIPGAFYDGGGAYQARLGDQALILSDPVSGLQKTFSLLPDGLRVDYRSPTLRTIRIPLAIDPWVRFERGWADKYQATETAGGWWWGISGEIGVQVASSGKAQLYAFSDTRRLMDQVENPNSEYPPGHYLPFPMALLEIGADQHVWVEIRITD